MRWAVVGSNGMFGKELVEFLMARGEEVLSLNRDDFDLENSVDDLAIALAGSDIVVNAVAYTAVDKAESELFEASTVNGIYAGKLAQAAALANARFFHISTDYVFDGMSKVPYKIGDQTNPQTAYGESKFVGEELVKDSGARFTIFRTAWLYGEHGRCFPKVIAALLESRDEISVVGDQIGSPTWTSDLAEVIVDHGLHNYGETLVHAVSSGQGSWFDFATEIQKSVPSAASKVIRSISTEEYPTPAKRPAWSVLDNSETKGFVIGYWRERWKVAAPIVLKEFI